MALALHVPNLNLILINTYGSSNTARNTTPPPQTDCFLSENNPLGKFCHQRGLVQANYQNSLWTMRRKDFFNWLLISFYLLKSSVSWWGNPVSATVSCKKKCIFLQFWPIHDPVPGNSINKCLEKWVEFQIHMIFESSFTVRHMLVLPSVEETWVLSVPWLYKSQNPGLKAAYDFLSTHQSQAVALWAHTSCKSKCALHHRHCVSLRRNLRCGFPWNQGWCFLLGYKSEHSGIIQSRQAQVVLLDISA